MNWIQLTQEEQFETIIEESLRQSVLIFKHSTSCSVSRMTLDRLQRNWNSSEAKETKTYFLDLLSFRKLSNKIASDFNVQHESPQVLIIKKGKATYHRSHYDIDFKSIKEAFKKI